MAVIVELFIPQPAGSPEEMPMTRVAAPMARSSWSSADDGHFLGREPAGQQRGLDAAQTQGGHRRTRRGRRFCGISRGPNSAGGAVVVWLAANIPSNSRR